MEFVWEEGKDLTEEVKKLRLLGYTNLEIASELNVSMSIVRNYIRRLIYSKEVKPKRINKNNKRRRK